MDPIIERPIEFSDTYRYYALANVVDTYLTGLYHREDLVRWHKHVAFTETAERVSDVVRAARWAERRDGRA